MLSGSSLYSESRIIERSEKVKRRWEETVDGVFFGVGCIRPVLVPIPVRKQSLPPRLTDYQTSVWITDDFRERRWSSLTDQVISFDFFPLDDDVPNGTRYVVFFDGQQESSAMPYNALCKRLNFGKGPDWYGGVLTMKFRDGQALNMTKAEFAMAKALVSTAVFHAEELPNLD